MEELSGRASAAHGQKGESAEHRQADGAGFGSRTLAHLPRARSLFDKGDILPADIALCQGGRIFIADGVAGAYRQRLEWSPVRRIRALHEPGCNLTGSVRQKEDRGVLGSTGIRN